MNVDDDDDRDAAAKLEVVVVAIGCSWTDGAVVVDVVGCRDAG